MTRNLPAGDRKQQWRFVISWYVNKQLRANSCNYAKCRESWGQKTALKRVAAGAPLSTPWLFEPAKHPHDRAGYCLSFYVEVNHHVLLLAVKISSGYFPLRILNSTDWLFQLYCDYASKFIALFVLTLYSICVNNAGREFTNGLEIQIKKQMTMFRKLSSDECYHNKNLAGKRYVEPTDRQSISRYVSEISISLIISVGHGLPIQCRPRLADSPVI